MRPDRFELSVEPGDWWFTLVLGLAAGLVLLGVLAYWRSRNRPGPALVLVCGGIALGLATGMSALDVSPYHPVNLRLKPYFSTLALGAAMVAAGLAGLAAVVGLGAVSGALSSRNHPVLRAVATVCVTAATAVVVLGLLDAEIESLHHPGGTDTSAVVPSTLVIDGLELPTGIAIAGDGTIAVTQLTRPVLTVYTPRPGADGWDRSMEVPLPVPEGAQVFHVALHPSYPDAPYAYVSAEQQRDDGSYLHVLRVSLDSTGEAAVVIDGLPIEQSRFSNHSGSALAFCGEYLFLSTGDTDPYADPARGNERLSIRGRAQVPAAPEGKILRYSLAGIDLEPAGVIAADPPVYAMGFRNVFGMGCDVETDFPLAADNGPSGLDQLRVVTPGSNHEWPLTETRDVIAPPLFSTGRAVIAPTGVVSRSGTDRRAEAIVSAYESRSLYLLPYSGGRATGPLRLLTEVEGGSYAVSLDARGCVFYSGPTGVWRLDEPDCVR